MSIQARGIVPDIEVELARIEAVEGGIVREEDLRGALDGSEQSDDGVENNEAENGDEAADTRDQSQIDYQLARALDLIRGVAVFGALKPAS